MTYNLSHRNANHRHYLKHHEELLRMQRLYRLRNKIRGKKE